MTTENIVGLIVAIIGSVTGRQLADALVLSSLADEATGAALVLALLNFLPALSLGPLSEGLL